ncbi:chromosome condensation protein, putative [Plasmodium ovale wallikeri]|uniref:Condensin complex subunit 2 n=2 Tax=Plasmodium ovale TaxID=36330 RepID=A0A1A8ZSE4_PLAOA|nr:chromosome condensation protein, putative [Plasmodium ovale wallikeri]SBT46809.1 chromosome condensation protein, putative [Plasmodium ovale wallikeri]SBT82206.1 condensin complex subunit 2, putative [Plasmodium ovale]
MKKLGVNTKVGANLTQLKENENIFKKPIEFNKNLRRLSFLNNNSKENVNKDTSGKCDKTRVKEINDVFKNCMVALSHNKICTRNAFDIRIIDHLEDLVNLNDEEINDELNDELLENGDFNLSFTRASKAIEGATKVYGYRVEAIYDQTYNFISNMNIAKQNEMNEEEVDEKKNSNEISNKKMKKRKLEFLQESSTLAKSSDITIDSIAVSNISVDTFFLKLNSTYDHSSCHSYLLPNLILNNDLSIQFDGDIDACEYKKRKKMEEVNTEGTEEEESGACIGNGSSSSTTQKRMHNRNNVDNYGNGVYSDNNNLMMANYKKRLYLRADILRDILFSSGCSNGSDDFNNLNICPELDYFKEEIIKQKLKRKDSKTLDEGDDDDDDDNGEEVENISTEKNDDFEEENAKKGLSISENISLDNFFDDNDYANNGSTNMGENKLNASLHNNNLNFNDYKIEDLNIENAMQESLAFDNINLSDSLGNNLHFSQSVMSLHQNANTMPGFQLPELMKSENKDFSLINSITGNFQMNTQNMFSFINPQGGAAGASSSAASAVAGERTPKRRSMISTIPDEDTLWNRNVMTFENRLDAIDVNSKFNYHYYIPSKLMINGNFRNLMEINKNLYKNKQAVLHNAINRKTKVAFDVSHIDFENLYIEINDIEKSTYDLWKKEKKKYVSNALFSIDHTSYIFETKDNCINCVNTVIDKIMKFSKSAIMSATDDCNNDVKLNVVLDEISNDFLTNEIDHMNYGECKNVDSMYADNMEEAQDSHLQEGLNDAIDKFYNMDFEDIWQNENKDNMSKQESKYDNTSILQLHQSLSHANSFGNAHMEHVSKFVDVSKIKKILCDIVKPGENEKDDAADMARAADAGEKDKQIVLYEGEKTTTFKEIINKTRSKLNHFEVKDTSVHMLFVCLLYTCNDQELLLEKMPNDEDFYIRYGLPVECHVKPDETLMLCN